MMLPHDLDRIRDGRTLSDDVGRGGNWLGWVVLAIFALSAGTVLAGLIWIWWALL